MKAIYIKWECIESVFQPKLINVNEIKETIYYRKYMGIGIMVSETKDSIIYTPAINEGNCCSLITVPKKSITQLKAIDINMFDDILAKENEKKQNERKQKKEKKKEEKNKDANGDKK